MIRPEGKEWQSTRSALNRATREGVRYVEGALADMPRGVLAQVHTISEVWVGDKGLPEMGSRSATSTPRCAAGSQSTQTDVCTV
jgi:lysylphosphatidylglycerol synthetase-like protein (DUF2156 family)